MAEKAKLTFESAQEKLVSSKEELTAKRDELANWMKEKGLKKTDVPTEEKALKKYTRLKSEIDALTATREELKEFVKNNKPAKVRDTKYNYPENATGDDKKKFRQLMRQKAKSAGVSVADYLADPAKFEKIVAQKAAEKASAKQAKEEAKKKKAESAETAEAPVKKKKKETAEEAPVEEPKKKKKKAIEED